ncbi:MAG: diguanylate cyclase domain-containing protein [Culicoidibacterales bacterium]
MSNNKNKKLFTLFLLGVIMIGILFISVLNIFSRATETVSEKNHTVSTQIESMISSIANLTIALSNFELIQNFDLSLQERALALKPFQQSSDLLMIAVMDEFGNTASSLEGGLANLSDREYFIEVKSTKKTIISDVIISRTTGEETIVIVHPILINNEFKGAVFSSIFVDTLVELASLNSNISAGYQTYIVAANLADYIVPPLGTSIVDPRFIQSDTKSLLYYPTSTGIYAVSFDEEPNTGWQIVTELNTFTYYSEIWLFMFLFIIVVTISLALIILELINTHNRQLVPLIQKINTDSLTELANRSYFEYEVTQWLKLYHSGVFIILDLDNFKKVNDTLGHNEGDKLLIETAKKLQSIFRKDDIIARLGGDEFVIFLPNPTELDVIQFRVEETLKRIEKTYKNPTGDIHLTVSIGAAIVDDNLCEYVELYEHADKALYEAKKQGKHGVVIKAKNQIVFSKNL